MKMIIAAAVLIATVGSASAGSNLGEITRYISAERAMKLSRSQLALAHNYIHSKRSESRKRAYVRSLANRSR